jgi:hypothetical protein
MSGTYLYDCYDNSGIRVECVRNGFTVYINGNTYVAKSKKELLSLISVYFKPTKVKK